MLDEAAGASSTGEITAGRGKQRTCGMLDLALSATLKVGSTEAAKEGVSGGQEEEQRVKHTTHQASDPKAARFQEKGEDLLTGQAIDDSGGCQGHGVLLDRGPLVLQAFIASLAYLQRLRKNRLSNGAHTQGLPESATTWVQAREGSSMP